MEKIVSKKMFREEKKGNKYIKMVEKYLNIMS